MCGEGSGEQQGLLIRFDASRSQDDMRAGNILRVKPEIVAGSDMKGQSIVLTVVFPDEDFGTVPSKESERL